VEWLTAYLRLMRPANIVTAISDILAGIAIGGSLVGVAFGGTETQHIPLGQLIIEEKSFAPFVPLLLLVLSTACLYGGGVVLNDVFDAELDKMERPERPIPSGIISKTAAAVFGVLLLITGVVAAGLSDRENLFSYTTLIALVIALAAVVYDKWAKHHNFFGPLTMGLCRGCNLLLGISIVTFALQQLWYIALVPLVYIAAITMISRGEVHGGKRTTLYVAAAFYLVVLLSILLFSAKNNTLDKTLAFLVVFALMIFLPLQRAIIKPEGPRIGRAVKGGVIALIAMNAAWAAAFGDIYFAVAIILLLPVSLLIARAFAVT
jgi:4-hydroxybenzoate polyprenyltransferase